MSLKASQQRVKEEIDEGVGEWVSHTDAERREGAKNLAAMIEAKTIAMQPHPGLVGLPEMLIRSKSIKYIK